jgi:leucyl aminopeptidase
MTKLTLQRSSVALRRHKARGANSALILPLIEGDVPHDPALAAAAKAGRFTAKAGEALAVPGAHGFTILAGIGAGRAISDWEAGGGAGMAAAAGRAQAVLLAEGALPEQAAGFGAGAMLNAWRFNALRDASKDKDAPPVQVTLAVAAPAKVEPAWKRAEAMLRGTLYARDLVAEPGNRLNPASFAARLRGLSDFGLKVEVLEGKRLTALGMGALRAVGGGAENGPHLVVLRWPGKLKAAPVAFVGKGVCFDTGGISIKPAAGMEDMRGDMAGAAAAAGATLALALRQSPAPAVAVLALAENAIGAASYRPGDILRTHSGRTIEVLDTDAEGRLILADALAYTVKRFRPRAMIDLATLTGSIITALGHHRAGVFGNDEALKAALMAAGEAVAEPLWPMPIDDEHREVLKSDIADLRQCAPAGSGAWGGRFLSDACHAAAFLREFVEGSSWAHLDIAGVEAHAEAAPLGPKGPSGFGVRLLDRLIAMRFERDT